MSSPGQKRCVGGHKMALFDGHKRCARCRDNKKGEDPCVKGLPCDICDAFTPEQKAQLATPAYQVKRDQSRSASVTSVESGQEGSISDMKGKSKPKKSSKSVSSASVGSMEGLT